MDVVEILLLKPEMFANQVVFVVPSMSFTFVECSRLRRIGPIKRASGCLPRSGQMLSVNSIPTLGKKS